MEHRLREFKIYVKQVVKFTNNYLKNQDKINQSAKNLHLKYEIIL